MNIFAENLARLRSGIPEHVKVVAVSKTQPPGIILKAYAAGQRCFGENKAQELINKAPLLPSDIEWHFIGHLQTNKVKQIIPYVTMIHSVDSLKLLREINRYAAMAHKRIRCLLQFHIATEETKYGLSYEEAAEILKTPDLEMLDHVEIAGVMGMATFTDDKEIVTAEFHTLHQIFHQLKSSFFTGNEGFKELSMGMSDDYQVAVREGSTIIRVGSILFGARV